MRYFQVVYRLMVDSKDQGLSLFAYARNKPLHPRYLKRKLEDRHYQFNHDIEVILSEKAQDEIPESTYNRFVPERVKEHSGKT